MFLFWSWLLLLFLFWLGSLLLSLLLDTHCLRWDCYCCWSCCCSVLGILGELRFLLFWFGCAASALPTITRWKYKINHYKRLPFVAVVVSLVPLRSVSTTTTITTQIQQKTLAMLSLHLFLIFCFCGLGEMIILLLLLLLLYSL